MKKKQQAPHTQKKILIRNIKSSLQILHDLISDVPRLNADIGGQDNLPPCHRDLPARGYPDVSDPASGHDLIAYPAVTNSTGFNSNTDYTFTWYVPENRRGENPSVTRQQDKWKDNDPSIQEGGYSAAMRIEIKGYYAIYSLSRSAMTGSVHSAPGYLAADIPKGTQEVVFNLHPGQNNTTDYNVTRNTAYNIRANITAIKDDAPRIEVHPTATYRYSYADGSNNLFPLGEDYDYSLSVGDPIPLDNAILNAKKDLVPDSGNYKDGVAENATTTVSMNGNRNIVNIVYYPASAQQFRVDVYWMAGGTIYSQDHFMYDSGTTIHPYGLWYFTYPDPLPGNYHFRTIQVIGASTDADGMPNITVEEDLEVYLNYTRNT